MQWCVGCQPCVSPFYLDVAVTACPLLWRPVKQPLASCGLLPGAADSFGATPIWYCGQFNALDCIPGPCAAAFEGRPALRGFRATASSCTAQALISISHPLCLRLPQCWACTVRTPSMWIRRPMTTRWRCAAGNPAAAPLAMVWQRLGSAACLFSSACLLRAPARRAARPPA